MMRSRRLPLALALAAFVIIADAGAPLLARGAAVGIMNSPGYQRRLQESRQQLGTQPEPPPPAVPHRKRHRKPVR